MATAPKQLGVMARERSLSEELLAISREVVDQRTRAADPLQSRPSASPNEPGWHPAGLTPEPEIGGAVSSLCRMPAGHPRAQA
jgi:hypothetical protein